MPATVKSPNGATSSTASHAVSLNGLVSFATAAGVLPDGSTNQTTILGEYMKRLASLVTVLICLLATLPAVYGQSVTGQISGNVVDPAGAVIPGVNVLLTNDLSKQVHNFTTDSNGSFVFTSLVPGNYSLKVTQAGFKIYAQTAITVSAQERVDLHEIKLAVGDVTSTVEVQGSSVHVATDSSDRSIGINLQQIVDTPTRGRNPLNLVLTLPGVQTLASGDYRGWSGGGIPGVNGGQTGQIVLSLDGATSQDSGNLNPGYLSPSMDTIGEVKLIVSNYTAEYGGRTGGQLTLITKNGTPKFHGTAYYYWRHEMFNANEWFNNKLNVQKPKYRYQNPGGTIGGPLIIPGTRFNKSRTKLFFFFSYDRLFNANTIDNTYTMPSALERAGDFSQTVTTPGALIPVYDPSTQTPFAGNKVPANLISPQGLAMLNLFPLPDAPGPGPGHHRGTAVQFPQPAHAAETARRQSAARGLQHLVEDACLCASDSGLPGGGRLRRHGRPRRRRLGTVPAQLSRAGSGRGGHIGLHLLAHADQRIDLWRQPRQAGSQPHGQPGFRRHGRHQDLCRQPAAVEGRQRQGAHAAAHQSGQQRSGSPPASQIRLAHGFQRAIERPGRQRRSRVRP